MDSQSARDWDLGFKMIRVFVFVLCVVPAAFADQYCFEQDAKDLAFRSEWTHNTVSLWGSAPRVGKDGVVFIDLKGYGYDDARKPGGGTDIVPLHGGAVKDVDGSWNVSLLGTLLQYSTVNVIGGADTDNPAYYLVSLWWNLDSHTLNGHGHMGNVAAGFSPHIPGAVDDSYKTVVWSVDCASIPAYGN